MVGTPVANRTRAETESLVGLLANTLALRVELQPERSFRDLLQRVREECLGAYAHQDLPFERLVRELSPERHLRRAPIFQVMLTLQNARPSRCSRGSRCAPRSCTTAPPRSTWRSRSCRGRRASPSPSTTAPISFFDDATIGAPRPGHLSAAARSDVAAARPERRLDDLPLLSPAERHRLALPERNDTAGERAQAGTLLPPALRGAGRARARRDRRGARRRRVDLPRPRRPRRRAGVGAPAASASAPTPRWALCLDRARWRWSSRSSACSRPAARTCRSISRTPRSASIFMIEDARLPDSSSRTRTSARPSRGGRPAGRGGLGPAPRSASGDTAAAVPGDGRRASALRDLHVGIHRPPKGGDDPAPRHRQPHAVDERALPAGPRATWCCRRRRPASTPRCGRSTGAASPPARGSPSPGPTGTATPACTSAPDDRRAPRVTVLQVARPSPCSSCSSPSRGSSARQPLACSTSRGRAAPARPGSRRARRRRSLRRPGHQPLRPDRGRGRRHLRSRRRRCTRAALQPSTRLHRQRARVRARGPPGSRRPRSVVGRALPGRRRRGPGLPRPARSDRGALRPRSVRRRARGAPLPDGRRGARPRLGADRDPRPHRRSGQDPRKATAWSSARSRGGPRGAPGGARGGGVGARGRAGRAAPSWRTWSRVGARAPRGRRRARSLPPRRTLPGVHAPLGVRADREAARVGQRQDRSALPAAARSRGPRRRTPIGAGYAPLRQSLVEAQLAEAWAEVLRLPRVGIHDHFFEIGGDSILSIQVAARAREKGLALTPRRLFERPTIAELAADLGTAGAVTAEQGAVTGAAPLTPIQRAWLEHAMEDPVDGPPLQPGAPPRSAGAARPGRAGARGPGAARPPRRPAPPVRAHRRPLARSASPPSVRVARARPRGPRRALPAAGVGPARPRKQAAAAAQASLDLERGPMVRLVLFTTGAGEPDRLLVVIHHLAVDAVSWGVVVEDLWTAYDAGAR